MITINIDEKLMSKVMESTGIKNKTVIINNALEEYLNKINRDSIVEGFGKYEFDLNVREFRDLELKE